MFDGQNRWFESLSSDFSIFNCTSFVCAVRVRNAYSIETPKSILLIQLKSFHFITLNGKFLVSKNPGEISQEILIESKGQSIRNKKLISRFMTLFVAIEYTEISMHLHCSEWITVSPKR